MAYRSSPRYVCSTLCACIIATAVGHARAADVTVDFDLPVQTQQMLYGTNEMSSQLRPSTIAKTRLKEINSRNIRYWLPADVRPNSITWDWDLLDDGVDKIVQAGATPMVCFAGIPDWMADSSNSGHPSTWNHPRDMNEWGQYCVSIIQHCASRGYPVEEWMWEIWNEPNNYGVSGGWSTEEYLELYDAAAVAMRAAFPNIQIGGPSTDHPSEHWIIPLLQGHDVQFITWHRYGAWDPDFAMSSSSYLSETHVFGDWSAMVSDWINEYRYGEGILNVCGEINLNAACCPIDDRIWGNMLIPWYTSAMRHLLLNRCDIEQFFVGTDKSWPNFGLFLGVGDEAGRRSPAFYAKKLFSAALPARSVLVSNTSSSSNLETLAAHVLNKGDFVVLINKSSNAVAVNIDISEHNGPNVTGGIWYTVDQAAYNAGGVTTAIAGAGNQQSTTMSGYALKVLELCTDNEPCTTDADADGLTNIFDNCPDRSNPSQDDYDHDGLGDLCDPCPGDLLNDGDGDGICGNFDNCLDVANPDQNDDDQDLVGNPCDNCIAIHNTNQADSDRDNVGDACDVCPNTPIGTNVGTNGCPTIQPDFDGDGDVDQGDFGYMQACISGSGFAQPDPACNDMHFDGDNDVDQNDVAIFRNCMSGANITADPSCMN